MSIGNYSLVNLKQQESFSTSFLLDSCTHITDLKSGFYHLVSNGRGPITLRSNHSFNPYEIRLIPKDETFQFPPELYKPIDPYQPIFVKSYTVTKVTNNSIDGIEEKKFLHAECMSLDDLQETSRSNYKQVYYRYPWDSTNLVPVKFDVDARELNCLDGEFKPYPVMSYMEFYFVAEPEKIDISLNAVESQKSFQKCLLEPGIRQTKILLSQLCGLVEIFQNETTYAPFTSVNQSSGSGKSRIVSECGQYVPMIFGTFRRKDQRGYPLMSPWFEEFYKYINKKTPIPTRTEVSEADSNNFFDPDDFVDEHSTLKYYRIGRTIIFIAALLNAYDKMFNNLKENNSSLSDFQIIQYISREMAEPTGQAAFNAHINVSEVESLKLEEIKGKIKTIALKYIAVCMEAIESDPRVDELIRKISSNFPFILVLDECAELLQKDNEIDPYGNTFFIIRRAMHNLGETLKVMIVAIGTNTDMTIFHRSVQDDSLRFVNRRNLLPPIILTSNWNIFLDKIKDELKLFPLNSKSVTSKSFVKLLKSFGRPLWSSVPKSVRLGVTKLQNGSQNWFNAAMAIISLRTGFDVSIDLKLSKTLVKSYLCTVFSSDYLNTFMTVGYPSEPILAIAARILMVENPNLAAEALFEVLREFTASRPIDKGEIAETIFNMYILLAVDKSNNVATNNPIPIEYGGEDSLIQKFLDGSTSFLLEVEKDVSKPHPPFDEDKKMDQFGDSVQDAEMEQVSDYIQSEDKSMDVDSGSNQQQENVKIDEKSVLEIPTPELNSDLRRYHITTVSDFLISLFGKCTFEKLKPDLPPLMLKGYVNASHVMRFDKFPFETAYTPERFKQFSSSEIKRSEPLPSGNKGKSRDLLDSVILRYSFLHQALIKFPNNYVGLDSAIPVLIPRAENGGVDDIFTFIGVQHKSSLDHFSAIVADKTETFLHYVPCSKHGKSDCEKECPFRTSEEDLTIIYGQQLSIILSGYEKNVEFSRNTQKDISANPFVSHKIRFSSGNLLQKQVCIMAKGIEALSDSSFMTLKMMDLSKIIIHYGTSPYRCSELYSKFSITEALINMQPSTYPEANKFIRYSRGYQELPDLFGEPESKGYTSENFEHTISKYNSRQ